MSETLGYCGYRCDLCPAYHENLKPETDRQAISDGWHKYFGFRIPAERISCPGCAADADTLDKDCPVRPCAAQKGMDTCARCPSFGCDQLRSRMDIVESVLAKFGDISQKDHDLFFLPYLGRDRLLQKRKTIFDGRCTMDDVPS
jgi:hypothetical protein